MNILQLKTTKMYTNTYGKIKLYHIKVFFSYNLGKRESEVKMEKIVSFKKDIVFNNNLAEITSISLEHTLHLEKENLISGDFILSGDYKMSEASVNVDHFSYNLPFDINVDDRYILDDVTVDIDDFYYEIINNNILSVNIDVKLDNLKENERALDEVVDEVIDMKPVEIEEISEVEDNISLFSSMDSKETYTTYKVYIVRQGDTLEEIMKKYMIGRDELEKYNNINDIKINDKLIIPAVDAQSK